MNEKKYKASFFREVGSIKINPYTLSFEDKFLNRDFFNDVAKKSTKVVRLSMMSAIIIYLVFGIIDQDIVIESPDKNYPYRIIGIAQFIIVFISTYFSFFRKYSQEILSSIILIGGINVLMISLDSGNNLYVGLILTSIYAHSLLRLRFIYASLTTWLLIIAYFVMLILRNAAPSGVVINNTFFLVTSNLLGMFASYSIEYFMRSAFWKSHIVNIKSGELEAEYARKSAELESARQIQLAMLPQERAIPNVDLSVVMKTASEIGGDYYDYHLSDDNTLTFAVGDVTGHGARAGAMVAAMKILFSNYAADFEITEFLRKANKSIRTLKLPLLYMAFAIGRIKNNHLEIAGVGLPPLLIYNSLNGSFEKVELKGLPLGSVDENTFEKKMISLSPGDTLALMTDGITELFDTNKNMFGYENIERIFSDSVNETTDKILKNILRQADEWSGDLPNEDDITLLILRIKESTISKSVHLKLSSNANNSSINKELTVQKLNDDGKINYACYSKNN